MPNPYPEHAPSVQIVAPIGPPTPKSRGVTIRPHSGFVLAGHLDRSTRNDTSSMDRGAR